MNREELLAKYAAGERNFWYAYLSYADLQKANLQKANLREAILQWADLRGADLQKANLREANLQWADFQWADLREANLDYSCWPLWRGTKHITVNMEFVYQILAHVAVLECDDPEFVAIREMILPYARKSHQATELGLVEVSA